MMLFFAFCGSVRFGGAMEVRRRNSQARSMWCSYGNQVETSWSSFDHTCNDLGIGNERKGRAKKLVKVG